MNTVNENNQWEDPEALKSIMKDRDLVRELARFLQCTQKDLAEALNLRATEEVKLQVPGNGQHTEKSFRNGYNQFYVLKSDGKNFRQINNPAPVLKGIQRNLLERLRQVPYSIAVTGGEPKTGIRKNVEPHVRNKYTLTMDLKDAFPSTSADRVHANLRSYLDKQLSISFPQLADADRERFKKAVIALLVKDNELPQGAPTSTHLLNLVLAKTDSEILKYLHGDEPSLHLPSYTRYIDDITISFRAFQAFIAPWRAIRGVNDQVREVLGSVEEKGYMGGDGIDLALKRIERAIGKIAGNPVNIHDESERGEFRKKVSEARKALVDLKKQSEALTENGIFMALDELVGSLDRSVQLEFLDGMGQIRGGVSRVVRSNGWKVKDSKTKVWTPNSPTQREITGVQIGSDGRLGVPRKGMTKYLDLAQKCAESPESLPKEFKDESGNPDPEAIARTLQGVRAFIVDIKGNVPQRFETHYKKARSRFFEGWKMSKSVHPVRWGSGY